MIMKSKTVSQGRRNAPPDEGAPFRDGGQHLGYSIESLTPKLVKAATSIADPKEGEAKVAGLVDAAFNSRYGHLVKETEAEIASSAEEVGRLQKLLEDLWAELAETPERLQVAKENQTNSERFLVDTPPWRWRLAHQFEGLLILSTLGVTLLASFQTAYANLLASGLPIFIEQPLLPMSMAAIPALASIAIKQIGVGFQTPQSKKWFRRFLFAGVGISVSAWGYLFAEQYHGFGGSLDLFGEEPVWTEKAFVGAQLAAEIFTGAVLFNRLADIALEYAPDTFMTNSAWENLQKRIAEASEQLAKAADRHAQAEGERANLAESLKLQIELATLSYWQQRARFDDSTL